MAKYSDVQFICLLCRAPAILISRELTCTGCKNIVLSEQNGSLIFVHTDESVVSDSVDMLKARFKRFGKFYNLLIDVISPVYPLASRERFKLLRDASKTKKVIMNLGSGSSNFGESVINIDIVPYESVDVICSIDNLPFANDCVDVIVNVAVLEHVPNPDVVVSEFLRVLKPNGKLFCFVPFIQGFHASPWDFQRYTKPGLEVLFSEFYIESIDSVGPTSGMLWTLQEWLAILLSFGSKKLHTVIWILVMVLTWPLKFLDVFLRHHPMAENISTGFIVKAVKL